MNRRDFIGTMTTGAGALALTSTAKSYGMILGANDRVHFGVIGLNSRAVRIFSIKANEKNATITHVCDVESNILAKYAAKVQQTMGTAPATEGDFRKLLARKEIDAVSIATPDHWHAPMAISALQAGKHVYVEKPCSHNPAEGVLLVQAQKKYGKHVQMGTQRRSSQFYIEAMQQIHEGLLGRAYYARAWYANTRKSIGVGKVVPVPATLDWELFQGPAPRQAYKDNVQPYNWHWFRTWGTGEALNNGTHEVDVCRWALGVDLPKRVSASGGRYQFKDDWEFYDTLNTSFAYDDKMISWENKSCNGTKLFNRDRGALIVGTKGSMMIDAGGYELYDVDGKKTGEHMVGTAAASSDLTGSDGMTDAHFANFIAAIQKGEPLTQPVASGNISVTMLQLSNIAWEMQRELKIEPASGHVEGDPQAMKLWDREYAPGWEPHL